MNPVDAMRLLEAALFLGRAVLFVNLDDLPEPRQAFSDRLWTVNPSNLLDVCDWIVGGKGGLYHDPDRLLDAAMVDKMIVVGSLPSDPEVHSRP